MSESDFDPTAIDLSSEEDLPKKRNRDLGNVCSSDLPDPLELLKGFQGLRKTELKKSNDGKGKGNNRKDLNKGKNSADQGDQSLASKSSSAVICKPATLIKIDKDDIEQYDYFASEHTAILDNWKSPQDLPDPYAVPDKSKFIKSTKPKYQLDIATKLQREFDHIEKIKKGKRQFQKDQEKKMRQQFDS